MNVKAERWLPPLGAVVATLPGRAVQDTSPEVGYALGVMVELLLGGVGLALVVVIVRQLREVGHVVDMVARRSRRGPTPAADGLSRTHPHH